jgi:DNA-cytosine methyltransferase
MNPMFNVLSLFDGISGAQVALRNLGIQNVLYSASEINPHAIQITQNNFPKTIQLGDIQNIIPQKLRGQLDVDLLIFGSPCTDLSVGKKGRKSLAGDNSKLFYLALNILKAYKPRFFLMENVASMNEESKAEITKNLGVHPVKINSRNFTGQHRERLYWCNWYIKTDDLPQKPVYFRDKLLDLKPKDLMLSEKAQAYMARAVKGGRTHWEFGHHSDTDEPFSKCVVANFKKGVPYNVLRDKRSFDVWQDRHFHPIECERLQGFPDDYTLGVSKSHRFEALGNSFTVPVIEALLRQAPI